MILELAGSGPDFIQMTAQYSNAVLVALMPCFSDAAQKLDLPVPHPISIQQVVGGGVMPYRYPNGDLLGAGIEVQGQGTRRRWYLGYKFGHISCVELRPSYFTIQDPDDLHYCYGEVRMSKEEAVKMARESIRKLGIPLEEVFAEQEPHVTLPTTVHTTNTLPYYRIEWQNPRSGSSTVDIGVNADAKRVERIYFGVGDDNLRRPSPKIDVPTPVVSNRPSVNPEYAWRLIPIILRAVDEYGKTLNLPLPSPLTTNHVARFVVNDNGGWPHSILELTNGWQFVYRNSMVNGYYAPDNMFGVPRKNQHFLIKDYTGKWKMTEAEAIKLVSQRLAKLNYPTNLVHMAFTPEIRKPAVPGIPRYVLSWEFLNETKDDIESKVEAEVDADRGELKSLYFDNKAFWGKPPKVDVPIGAQQNTTLPAWKSKEPMPPRTRGQYQTPQ